MAKKKTDPEEWTTFTIDVPCDLKEACEELAQKAGENRSLWIRNLLKKATGYTGSVAKKQGRPFAAK